MPRPMTPAERVAATRARRAAAGLTRLELWVHPDDHAVLREQAERLANRRKRAHRKEVKPPASG